MGLAWGVLGWPAICARSITEAAVRW